MGEPPAQPRERAVAQVALLDLADGDVVWADDGFWPIRDVAIYPEYVGYTVLREQGPARLTGAYANAILRVIA
jgi:hypothetical protein